MRNNLRNAIHHRPIWLLICVQTVLFLAGLGWFRAASRQGLVTAVREATGCRRWPVPIFNFGTIRPKADSRAINITFCKRRFAMPAESKRIILEMSVLARPDRRSFLVVAGRLGRNLIHRRCRLLWGATEKAGFVRAPSSKPEGEAVSANKRTAGELTIESRVYWGLHSLQIGPAAVGQLAVPIGTKDIHVRIIVSGQILVPVQYLVIPGSPPSTGPPVSCVIWINSPTLQQGFRQGFYDWKSRGAYRQAAHILRAAGCTPWAVGCVIRAARERLDPCSAEDLLLAESGDIPAVASGVSPRECLLTMAVAASERYGNWRGGPNGLMRFDFPRGRLYLGSITGNPSRRWPVFANDWLYFDRAGSYWGDVILARSANTIPIWSLRAEATTAALTLGGPAKSSFPVAKISSQTSGPAARDSASGKRPSRGIIK